MADTDEIIEKIKKMSEDERNVIKEYILNCEDNLRLKAIGEIKGTFNIPKYQRGYRWTELEVKKLIEDIIENGNKTYCLQPVVIGRDGNNLNIIDGQQRLTTLFIIKKCLGEKNIGYNLKYETRPKSEDFLNNINNITDKNYSDENIDFHFLSNAYKTAKEYFKNKTDVEKIGFKEKLNKNVKVIWYQIDGNEYEQNDLFQRLNMWKIPLTNAELVKALFLNDSALINNRAIKEKIALQWDNIERTLCNEEVWYFLTTDKINKYQTKIDLILNLKFEEEQVFKKDLKYNEKDTYKLFYYFQDKIKNTEISLESLWDEIYTIYETLMGWYHNHELYHKIGYLIQSKHKKLVDIYVKLYKDKETKVNSKKEFKNKLNGIIADCILEDLNIDESEKIENEQPYEELVRENLRTLSYGSDTANIQKILFLINVDATQLQDSNSQWFPFSQYFNGKWSLEHILAQNSRPLDTLELQKKWLNEYQLSFDDKKDQITEYLKFENKDDALFEGIYTHFKNKILHSIDNMALLSGDVNSSLNNDLFSDKRKKIVEYASAGEFIPIWTKKVFFKAFEDSDIENKDFWSPKDRQSYFNEIVKVLTSYLNKKEKK